MSATISVIIPVRNSAAHLRDCLRHLDEAPIRPLERIVIDDGSSDDSAAVAEEHGATTIRCEPQGPAAARNLGAKAARGDILLFLDADVRVHGDTIQRVLWNFDSDSQLDAVIGSYDDSPGSRDFISVYKNLMHCFHHQHARAAAGTFWSGCGAIRRDVFLAYSGFDPQYRRPAIEDIELGYRLVRDNRKILLDRAVQVKHLKHWTFWNVLKTDIFYRGIPWTELILRDRRMPNDLNVQVSERVSVGLAFVLVGLLISGTVQYGGYFLIPFLGILLSVLATYWIEAFSRPHSKGAVFLMASFASGFLWLAQRYQMPAIALPVLLAYALLFARSRYGYATRRRRRFTGLAYAVYLASAVLFMLTYLPSSPLVLGIIAILLLLVIIHRKFYVFFASKLDRLSTLAVIPLHMLYHFYNGISFLIGLTRHTVKTLSDSRA
jgi:glycosyltransferase involved in cell wall biosynthesis